MSYRVFFCCLLGSAFLILPGVAAAPDSSWEGEMFERLYAKYLETTVGVSRREAVDRLARSLGERLVEGGTAAVPAEDLALFALLQTRLSDGDLSSAGMTEAGKVREAPAEEVEAREIRDEVEIVTKGDEGIVRGLERLSELPLTERMVITGDVASGIQAASISGAPTLTTTLGRVRMNMVTRALPRSSDNLFGEGNFFLQMISAGGAPGGEPLGGPASFTAFNDLATDRSRFNEPSARGNIYLAKAFYQQGFNLGEKRIMAHAGVLDITDYFDTNLFANNEARQFMNGALVNGAGYKTGIVGPGLVGEIFMQSDRPWLRTIVFRGGYSVSNTFRAFTSPIWAGEVELQTMLRGRDGSWRFGGTLGHVAGVGSVNIFHTSVDHWLTDRLGIFGRYALASAGPGSQAFGPVRQSYSSGVQLAFAGENDRVSAWGIGFSQAFGIDTGEPLASERVFETYYRWQVGRNFSLTPDFQIVLGSGGRTENGSHAIFGMRMNYVF